MSTEANRNYLLMSLMLQVHNVLLTPHADEQDLLRQVCGKLALHWPYRMAWVGYAETDGTIRVMAVAGEAASFLPKTGLRWDGAADDDNPVGACIRSQRLVHVTETSAVEACSSIWKDFTVRIQVSSTLVQPLFVHDRCIGALCVCSGLADNFTFAVEHTLLALAVQQIGFSLGVQREQGLTGIPVGPACIGGIIRTAPAEGDQYQSGSPGQAAAVHSNINHATCFGKTQLFIRPPPERTMQAIQESLSSRTAEATTSEFLIFKLGNEEYGINIFAVQEICGYDAMTMADGAPDFIKGKSIINLAACLASR